jgi:hypothetical protein
VVIFFVVVMIGWISGDFCFIVTGGNVFVVAMIGWISGDFCDLQKSPHIQPIIATTKTLPPVTIKQKSPLIQPIIATTKNITTSHNKTEITTYPSNHNRKNKHCFCYDWFDLW